MNAETAGSAVESTRLVDDPAPTRAARRFLSVWFTRWHAPDAVLDVGLLLVTELITNAVRHGSGVVLVAVSREAHSVRVAVHDRSPALPVLTASTTEQEGGRGIHLIDVLASRWGTVLHLTEGGKDVWFELALSPSADQ